MNTPSDDFVLLWPVKPLNLACDIRLLACPPRLYFAAPKTFLAVHNISQFWPRVNSARLAPMVNKEERYVSLALRFEMLAICTAFVFLGAILLGAF